MKLVSTSMTSANCEAAVVSGIDTLYCTRLLESVNFKVCLCRIRAEEMQQFLIIEQKVGLVEIINLSACL